MNRRWLSSRSFQGYRGSFAYLSGESVTVYCVLWMHVKSYKITVQLHGTVAVDNGFKEMRAIDYRKLYMLNARYLLQETVLIASSRGDGRMAKLMHFRRNGCIFVST